MLLRHDRTVGLGLALDALPVLVCLKAGPRGLAVLLGVEPQQVDDPGGVVAVVPEADRVELMAAEQGERAVGEAPVQPVGRARRGDVLTKLVDHATSFRGWFAR